MKLAVMMEQEEFDATTVVADAETANKTALRFGDRCRYLRDGHWWLAMNHLGSPQSAISYPLEVIGGIQDIRSPEEIMWKAACEAVQQGVGQIIRNIVVVMPQDAMSTIVASKTSGDVEVWTANDNGTFERSS